MWLIHNKSLCLLFDTVFGVAVVYLNAFVTVLFIALSWLSREAEFRGGGFEKLNSDGARPALDL
jgi:hypothetical protein